MSCGRLVACSRLSVIEDDRKSERATSGISSERDPGEKKKRATSPFSLPDPTRRPPAFVISAPTESLERASRLVSIWSRWQGNVDNRPQVESFSFVCMAFLLYIQGTLTKKCFQGILVIIRCIRFPLICSLSLCCLELSNKKNVENGRHPSDIQSMPSSHFVFQLRSQGFSSLHPN